MSALLALSRARLNGFDPAFWMYVEPLANTIELKLVVPNALPVKPVSAVNDDPL